jgi:hypothetical protein
MVLNVTTWSPDTCDCVIEYEWDDSQDESSRIHIAKAILKDCGLHKKTKDRFEHYDIVMEENTRKNISFGLIQEEEPTLTPNEYDWSFDAKRDLHIKLKRTIDADKKTRTQDKLDKKFGKGKAVIE